MPNLMQRGAAWLGDRLKESAGRVVLYRRGQHTVALTAWTSSPRAEEVGVGGVIFERHDSLDVTVLTTDLVLHGERVKPARGDRVEITRGNETSVYEAMSMGDEPPYSHPDESHTLTTIHTKQVQRFV